MSCKVWCGCPRSHIWSRVYGFALCSFPGATGSQGLRISFPDGIFVSSTGILSWDWQGSLLMELCTFMTFPKVLKTLYFGYLPPP